jgi:hypothetical protein
VKRIVAALLVSGCVAVVAAQAGRDAKGSGKSTTTNYPAQFVLQDRSGDLITSDGQGPYVNGVAGVTAEFQITTTNGVVSSSQFFFEFAAAKRQAARYVNLSYTAPVATGCNPNPSDNPVGKLQGAGYGAFFIATEPIAGTQLLAAEGSFDQGDGTLGPFRFANGVKLDPVLPYYCSDMVVVTRPSRGTWTLTTDTQAGAVYYIKGQPAYPENPEEVGSIAQMMSGGESGSLVGNYRMPFFMTISCLSTTSCPS